MGEEDTEKCLGGPRADSLLWALATRTTGVVAICGLLGPQTSSILASFL